MLKDLHIHPTIPASDMERAKKFYTETLGFDIETETPGGLVMMCAGGSWFVVFPSPTAGSSPNTLAGWKVDDLEKEVAELKDRGVVFEEYDLPDFKTENSIVTRGEIKSSWFKDSEGNTLGIVQLDALPD